MAENFELHAQHRSLHGKGASRRMRSLDHNIPAVVYGAKKDPVSITLEHRAVSKALQNEAFYSHILTLHIDGKAEKVVLKAIQRHPFKPLIMHMDLLRVNANEKLTMHIPLHFTNEDIAPGLKNEGGVITHHLSDVEVSCLPSNLPEFIEVDLAKLSLNESIHLSALKLPKGVEIVALMHGEDRDVPVVSIHEPRIHEEPETPVTEITSEKTADEEAGTTSTESSEEPKE